MKHAVALAAVLAFSAAPGLAEEGLYFGVGLSRTHTDSSDGGYFGAESRGNQTMLGLTMGYRLESQNGFYGGEIDGDFAPGSDLSYQGTTCAMGPQAPFFCTHDATVRVRGIAGRDLGKGYEGFGTLGLALTAGSAGIDNVQTDRGINAGLTFGGGVQRDLSMGGKLRAEVILDMTEKQLTRPRGFLNFPFAPEMNTVSFKLTYIFDN